MMRAIEGENMNVFPDSEARVLASMGDAFGDPTRRALYGLVVEAAEPLSAGEAADRVGVHRTVARAHLQRLTELGLLKIRVRRGAKGGRPAKVYVVAPEPLAASLPPRRYERLAALLVGALRRSASSDAEAAAAAAAIGWQFGREEVARLGNAGTVVCDESGGVPKLTPPAAQRWLDDNGFRATVIDDRSVDIYLRNCIFRELAMAEPLLVCAVDQGILRGLFAAPESAVTTVTSIAAGDDCCRLRLTL
jgi:predicted ArsR family transcriptional regulator